MRVFGEREKLVASELIFSFLPSQKASIRPRHQLVSIHSCWLRYNKTVTGPSMGFPVSVKFK